MQMATEYKQYTEEPLTSEADGVVPAQCDQRVERGNALLARVAEAPALVHGTIQEVDVPISCQGDWREPSVFGISVHALDDKHLVL